MINDKKNALGEFSWKMYVILLAAFAIVIVSFYFLLGDQLHFRDSRGNIVMDNATNGSIELVENSTIEQEFKVNIQRLNTIGVQWGTYYRENTGTLTMKLINLENGKELMNQSYLVSDVEENQVLFMHAQEPIEGIYGARLLLSLTADSIAGQAITPLLNQSKANSQSILTINGQESEGVLCFSASGQDYIWIGLNYWKLAIGTSLVLIACILYEHWRFKKGYRSYLFHALIGIKKYRFLIMQLISRDFKTKYKRSVLGMFWSFLNPLLLMTIQFLVFSTIFKADIPNYPVYLLIGIVSFNFFSEACGMSLTSILGNANLITKVYMPKYVYPLTRVMSSVINLMISLIPLLIVSIITGVQFQPAAILAFYFWCCLILFSLGLGMLLSVAMVFFRDMQFLWNVFNMAWMYATPIFYPESILPTQVRSLMQFNPLYQFLQAIRMCILQGISPEPIVYINCLLLSVCMLIVGSIVFYKTQDKFILYL